MTKELRLMSWPVRLPSSYFTGFLMINHPPVEGACEFGWGRPVPLKDEKLLNDICDYYEKNAETSEFGSFEWDGIVATHNEYIELLKNRNLDMLHEYLRVMFRQHLCQGTAQGKYFYDKLLDDKDEIRKNTGFSIYDKFLSLMEINTIIPMFSPEEYTKKQDFLKFYTIDPDDYMDMMERQFDCDLKAPEFQGDHFGIQTKRHGLYSDRDIMAMDVAIKIKERYWNRKNVRIADLGGGVGYLAYWLTKLGFDDITYVDLPTVTTSAMYFLGTNGIHNVKFITPEEFEGDFDVVINVDGMTQYSKESAQKYMRKIEENAKHFMSVNREFDDFRVSEICDMRRISRSPSWVRRGYVEEDYVPENT